MQQISVFELARRLTEPSDTGLCLLDVREEWEWRLARIEGAHHIPMGWVADRRDELPGDRTIVVFCHHGVRSLQVVYYLKSTGFEKVVNLNGGIDAWALYIDTAISRY